MKREYQLEIEAPKRLMPTDREIVQAISKIVDDKKPKPGNRVVVNLVREMLVKKL